MSLRSSQWHFIIWDCQARSEQSEGIFYVPRSDNLLYKIATLRSQRRIATLPLVARNQAVSQLIARFKVGNKHNILPKKEYLKCLFTLIIALNGKFLSNFFIFLNCDTAWMTNIAWKTTHYITFP